MRKAASLLTHLLVLTATFALLFFVLVAQTSGQVVLNSITAKALNDHSCNSSEWHFVITQIKEESLVPVTITVKWSNGATESVGKWKYTGKTAHYVSTAHLNSAVVEAKANIYSEWSGQFNLSHGPCGGSQVVPTATPAPTTISSTKTPTPTASPVVIVLAADTTKTIQVVETPVVAGVQTEQRALPSTGGDYLRVLAFGLLMFGVGLALVTVALVEEGRLEK